MTLANQLTLTRLILIPVFVVVYYLPFAWSHFAAAAVFTLAGITDWLDGYVARKYDQSTPLGAFMDPVADKLMVAVAVVMLVGHHSEPLFTVASVIIIGREIVISALREWMAELGKRASVAVSYVGKIKTTAQMLSIGLLLAFNTEWYSWLYYTGYVLFYVAAALTLWSMVIYLRAAWPDLMADE
jgi:CDP-diacylglycerol--glycerol-3-phosphate 3-phosphatidyltransferase